MEREMARMIRTRKIRRIRKMEMLETAIVQSLTSRHLYWLNPRRRARMAKPKSQLQTLLRTHQKKKQQNSTLLLILN